MSGASDTFDDSERVDTGFDDPEVAGEITATVREPSTTTGLTLEGLDALKAMVALPKEFGPPEMVALARDLAKNIHPLQTILSQHSLTNAQYEFLSEHNEFFKQTLEQLSREWQGITSTAERLKHQALAALEAQLPSIASRMGKQSEKLIDAVEAAKLFAKIGAVDGGAAGGNASGERFTISIDLGADTRIVLGNGGDQNQGVGSVPAGPVSRDAERTIDATPIRSVTKRPGNTE